ncbi:hypothetical protein TNCV_2201381 [Trichonephila clavipes]|uniref:Uncharacterized protein n=1 Tax=Trichonephila clavipes TaxID=2585209 RepID=A0A8X6VLS3_TRICX|nr:hypothetical protein TNCV_2201381 [Trichonephila clavipes]
MNGLNDSSDRSRAFGTFGEFLRRMAYRVEEVCPKFAQNIGNVTQVSEREVKWECVVDNLGHFRVSIV